MCQEENKELVQENDFDEEDLYQEGLKYLRGSEKITPDIRKAFQKFLKAEKLGHMEASIQLAILYQFNNNNIIYTNYNEAFKRYKKAAEAGYALAYYYLAECYFYGWGTEKNDLEAFNNYIKAANQDIMLANVKLSDMYANGIGTDQDCNKAMERLNLAKTAGFNDLYGGRFLSITCKRGSNINQSL